MSFMNPEYGRFITSSEAASMLGHDFCTLDEPVRLKWRLSSGEWYFAVAKYYSKIGIAFERTQDDFKYVDILSNTLIKLEDGRTWDADGKRLEERQDSFLEFFNGIAREQNQQVVIQDEDDDFIV